MEALLPVAIGLFVATHLDTYVVLVAFCSKEGYRLPELFVGHYVGFGIGLLGAVLATIVLPEGIHEYAFLLGLLPIALGLWGFRVRDKQPTTVDPLTPSSALARGLVVTTAGIGLSGENIAVFIPFFLALASTELLTVVMGYLLGAGIVFFLAFSTSRTTEAIELPNWLEHRLVPGLLVLVGTYVLTTGWIAS